MSPLTHAGTTVSTQLAYLQHPPAPLLGVRLPTISNVLLRTRISIPQQHAHARCNRASTCCWQSASYSNRDNTYTSPISGPDGVVGLDLGIYLHYLKTLVGMLALGICTITDPGGDLGASHLRRRSTIAEPGLDVGARPVRLSQTLVGMLELAICAFTWSMPTSLRWKMPAASAAEACMHA